MHPIVKLDRALVALEVDQTVHVLLELTAPPAPAVAERAPIDVVAVIDRSGSMSGQPLQAVLAATGMLAKLLGPDDRMAVVTFDDQVRLALPLAHHDAAAAAKVLGHIHSGGSTNLSGGWLKGLEVLMAHGRPEALKRLIVLTDGHANVGITDADALSQLAASANAQQVTTSMIGFADGYDEQLLAALADAGGGNDYWCAGPDQATKVFADEFAGLASVVAQNISVEIRPSDAVAECLVLNEYPLTVVDGGLQVALGDAYGGEHRKVVSMLRLKAPTQAGQVHVADLVIRWASTIGDVALMSGTVPVMVGAIEGLDLDHVAPDPDVVEQVNLLKVARGRKDANDAARRGDHAGAARLIDELLPMAAAMPAMASELDELRTDAVRLASGDWHEADMKRNYSAARTMERGRKRRYD